MRKQVREDKDMLEIIRIEHSAAGIQTQECDYKSRALSTAQQADSPTLINPGNEV